MTYDTPAEVEVRCHVRRPTVEEDLRTITVSARAALAAMRRIGVMPPAPFEAKVLAACEDLDLWRAIVVGHI